MVSSVLCRNNLKFVEVHPNLFVVASDPATGLDLRIRIQFW